MIKIIFKTNKPKQDENIPQIMSGGETSETVILNFDENESQNENFENAIALNETNKNQITSKEVQINVSTSYK
jgi:hypothetical protein